MIQFFLLHNIHKLLEFLLCGLFKNHLILGSDSTVSGNLCICIVCKTGDDAGEGKSRDFPQEEEGEEEEEEEVEEEKEVEEEEEGGLGCNRYMAQHGKNGGGGAASGKSRTRKRTFRGVFS